MGFDEADSGCNTGAGRYEHAGTGWVLEVKASRGAGKIYRIARLEFGEVGGSSSIRDDPVDESKGLCCFAAGDGVGAVQIRSFSV